MTIITANTTEDPWKLAAEESLQEGISGTRVFNIYSDIQNETLGAVLAACPVGLGDLFPGTLTAQCVSRVPARASDTYSAFTVTCSYKSILNQIEQSRIDYPNPLDRTAKITWTARTVMMAVTRMQLAQSGSTKCYQLFDPAVMTFDGKPYSVANAANDPFDPPLEVATTEWIATVTKNVTAAPTWFGSYENAVNNADFVIDGLTVPKGCGKLEGIKFSEKMKENGTVYRQLSFSIITRPKRPLRTSETDAPEPWDIEVLNEGMRKAGASGWTNILDSNSNPVMKPVPLDANGNPISVSGAPIPESSLTWMLFRPFNRKDFSVLPLT